MLIGYARVSKADGSQNLDLQKDALIKAGVDSGRIYHDYASSRKDNRPGLQSCIKALQPGNILVVWKLDRLGRDIKDLISMVDMLGKKEIGFKVLQGLGAEIDTGKANGRFVFNIFAALAEYERELIKERTKAGLEAARARGRKGGRPRKMDKAALKMAISAMKEKEAKPKNIAKKLNITTTTLYDYVNGDGSLKEKGEHIMLKE